VGHVPANRLPARKSRRRRALRAAFPLGLAVVALSVTWITVRLEAQVASPFPVTASVEYHPLLAQHSPASGLGAHAEGIPLEMPFEPGQTVSDVLSRFELPASQVQQVIDELSKYADLRRIRPRDRYSTIYDPGRGLRSFELTVDGKGKAAVRHDTGDWEGTWEEFSRRTLVERVTGRLEGSLEQAIRDAGGEGALAYVMADVLQWDLDFNRDLRTGDTFEVLYEKVFLDGAYHSLGGIVAMSYENLGRRLEAYRHGAEDTLGYYDAEGRPLRKMFLRSPMRYSRVTSRFSGRRFHPILKRYRPHYGVDYGAPTGTPVRVTAGGVVLSAAWEGGGGRMVKVRHPNGYLTAYLHLSNFASGIRSGRRVGQGDVIGYVGSTGLATAPHLDYRVQRDGRWIDPLSLKSVPADPVATEDLPTFLAQRDRLRRSLWEGAPYESEASEQGAGIKVAAATTRPRVTGGR
jgi:murein DD-endopeptidase MepM/ murein hydrolase activator NlpD